MNRWIPRAALAALTLAGSAPALAISARDAEAAQAACTAAAHERRIDVRAVRQLRNDGARRIAVELETNRRQSVWCRWDRRNGRTEFPNGEGYRPPPPVVVAPAPLPVPHAVPPPVDAARPALPPGPIEPGLREAAELLCQDLARTRTSMDSPPPAVIGSRRAAGGAAIDIDLRDGTLVLRCRFDVASHTAHWR